MKSNSSDSSLSFCDSHCHITPFLSANDREHIHHSFRNRKLSSSCRITSSAQGSAITEEVADEDTLLYATVDKYCSLLKSIEASLSGDVRCCNNHSVDDCRGSSVDRDPFSMGVSVMCGTNPLTDWPDVAVHAAYVNKQTDRKRHTIVPCFGVHPWCASFVTNASQLEEQSPRADETHASLWKQVWWTDTLCRYLEAFPDAAVAEIGLDRLHLKSVQTTPQPRDQRKQVKKEVTENIEPEEASTLSAAIPVRACCDEANVGEGSCAVAQDGEERGGADTVHLAREAGRMSREEVVKAREEKKRLKQLRIEGAKLRHAHGHTSTETAPLDDSVSDNNEHSCAKLAITNTVANNGNAGGDAAGGDSTCEILFQQQLSVFETQLSIAAFYKRPVSVHCVRAWGPMLDILTARVNQYIAATTSLVASSPRHTVMDTTPSPYPALLLPPSFVFHGFTGSSDFVRSIKTLFSQRLQRHITKLQRHHPSLHTCVPHVFFGIGVNTTLRCKGWWSVLPRWTPSPPTPSDQNQASQAIQRTHNLKNDAADLHMSWDDVLLETDCFDSTDARGSLIHQVAELIAEKLSGCTIAHQSSVSGVEPVMVALPVQEALLRRLNANTKKVFLNCESEESDSST